MKKWIRVLIVILIVLVLACGGMVYWVYSMGAGIMDNPLSAFIKDNTKSDSDSVLLGDAEMVRDEGVINILLLGIDSNQERESKRTGYRSDMVMLCSVDMNSGKVSMLSIPRDTYATVYKLDYDTGDILSETQNKINSAYSFGGGPSHYGAENSMQCVSKLLSCDGKLNVPIDFYVSLDMDGITKIADSLGGVEVTLTADFPGIGSEGETVTLSGSDAEQFVRNRHDVGGDLVRASHQQQFMLGIAQKIKDMGAVQAAPKLYDEFLTYAKTNLSLEQVLALASVLNDLNLDDISFNTTTGKGEMLNGSSVIVPDMDDMYTKVTNLLYKIKE